LAEVTTLQALQEITIRGLEIDMEGRFLSVSNLCPRQVQAILTAKEWQSTCYPDLIFLIFLVLALSIPIAWDTMKIPNLRLFVRWPAGGVPIHVQGYRWLQVPRGGRQGATSRQQRATIKLYTVVYCTWFIFIWGYHPPTKQGLHGGTITVALGIGFMMVGCP
jgi:hypothetical protein